MPKLTKKELPYLMIKSKSGELLYELDGSTEIGGGIPLNISLEDEDLISVSDENDNTLASIRAPKDCLIVIEHVPED